MSKRCPFRYSQAPARTIRPTVALCSVALSLRNVEGLLHGRGIESALSVEPPFMNFKMLRNVSMSAMADRIAAFETVTYGSNGPEADLVKKGGKRKFAAGA